ncbi:DUF6113 family protein [Microbacterium sp. cx-55]|uniref:DUF6113 family protein n=1 Tax=unclassified Microbacterium TaxID=2609290 RepID=UPI001CC0C036|nr:MULTISPECIES: DUF6113 family protein [unclassified Microbacterium]MBZ4485896.1 DUF6113 family protein [Microbacterium sp. cx-55]MCC4906856.1 DUF6113 family protein [Microbacterium sp. cx-59]UGB34228.1 DUF6113 family protein [Microbacterium sp. cx-55]
MDSRFSRVAAWAIALVVGVVYGAAGSLAHSSFLGVVPVGLMLGLAGSAALVVALRLLTGDRWAALAGGGGMMLATYFFSQPSPGGSVLFTQQNEILALVWMAGVPLVTALVVAWPDLRGVGRVRSEAN